MKSKGKQRHVLGKLSGRGGTNGKDSVRAGLPGGLFMGRRVVVFWFPSLRSKAVAQSAEWEKEEC